MDFAAQLAYVAEALGGLDEKLFENFFHQSLDVLALGRREMRGRSETCVKKGGAVVAEPGTQCGNESDEFDAGLPREKFGDVVFDNGFGAGYVASIINQL